MLSVDGPGDHWRGVPGDTACTRYTPHRASPPGSPLAPQHSFGYLNYFSAQHGTENSVNSSYTCDIITYDVIICFCMSLIHFGPSSSVIIYLRGYVVIPYCRVIKEQTGQCDIW